MQPRTTYSPPVFLAPRRFPAGSRACWFAAPWAAWEAWRVWWGDKVVVVNLVVRMGLRRMDVVVGWFRIGDGLVVVVVVWRRRVDGRWIDGVRVDGANARSSARNGAASLGCSILLRFLFSVCITGSRRKRRRNE